jgi:hypothetical protein
VSNGITNIAITAASLTLALGACHGPAGQAVVEDEPELLRVDTTVVATPPPDRPARPDSIVGEISVEGMAEPMVLRLFRAPQAFPLAFSTYVPADMEAGVAASGEGDAVRFVARFGGVRDERAGLSLHVPAAGLDAAAAQRLATEMAAMHGAAERMSSGGYTWALEEYRFHSPERVGRVALGRHDSRYFLLLLAHPPEFGDGFAPRAARILGEWQWADGSRLGS